MDTGASKYMDVIKTEKFNYDVFQGLRIDGEAQSLKESLVKKIKNKVSNVKDYQIYWMPKGVVPDESEEHHEYIKQFCDDFYADCRALIENAEKDKGTVIAPKSYYSKYDEVLHHLKFCLSKSEDFCGQEEVLEVAKKYILDPSARKPLIIHAESGHGKTSVMAMIMKTVPKWLENKPHGKLIRFLGTSPLSHNIYDVLFGVLCHLSDVYDIYLNRSPANYRNMKKLVAFIPRYLRTVANVAKEPIVILLDSVDQLYPSNNAYSMDWMPLILPQNLKLIVSTLSQEHGILNNLKKRLPDKECFVQLPVLSEESATVITEAYLKRYKRMLTVEQMQFLLQTLRKDPSPLFLKLLIDDARKWTSYNPLSELALASNVKEAINKLFQKLENKFGYVLISHTLGYITVGLSGLSEFEIEDVLSCDDDVLNEVYNFHDPPVLGIVRLPPALWARIHFDLQGYLVERMAHGKQTMNWYHRQFIETATERYLVHKCEAERLHANLVKIFLQDDGYKSTIKLSKRNNLTIEDADRQVTPQPFSVHNQRKLACLPYHCLKSWRLQGIETAKADVFLNYKFLFTRIAAFSLAVVCADLQELHDETGDEEIQLMLNFLRVNKDDLSNQIRFSVCILANIAPAEEHVSLHALRKQALEYLDSKAKTGLVPDFPCLAPRLDASSAYETSVQGFCSIVASSNKNLLLKASKKTTVETCEDTTELKSDYSLWCSELQDLKHDLFEGLDINKEKVILCDQRAYCVAGEEIVACNFVDGETNICNLSSMVSNLNETGPVKQFVLLADEETGACVFENKIVLIELKRLKLLQTFNMSQCSVAVERVFAIENFPKMLVLGKNKVSSNDSRDLDKHGIICTLEQGQDKPSVLLNVESDAEGNQSTVIDKGRWFAVPIRGTEKPHETQGSFKIVAYKIQENICKRELKLPDAVSKMRGHPEKMSMVILTTSGRVYHIKFYERSDKADVLVAMLNFQVQDFAVDWDEEIGFLCSGAGEVNIYDFKTDKNLGSFTAHPTRVQDIVVQDQQCFTLGANNEMKVWSVQTLIDDITAQNSNTQALHREEILTDQMNVTGIITLPDGNELVTCHEDGVVKAWSLSSLVFIRQFKIAVAANLVHNLVNGVIAFHDTVRGQIRMIEYSSGKENIAVPDSLRNIIHSTTNKARDILYLLSVPSKGREQIDIISVPLRTISKTIHLQRGLIYVKVDMFLSEKEDYVVLRHKIPESEFNTIKAMWKKGNFSEQDHRFRFTAVSLSQGSGAFHPCYRQHSKIPVLGDFVRPYNGSAMLISTRRWLVFWDIPTGKCVQKHCKGQKFGMFYRPHWVGQKCKGKTEVFATTPNKKYIVCGSEDGYVFVYDFVTGIPVGSTKPATRHSAEVHCLALSPDSRWAASSCCSSVLKLWDIATATEQFSMRLDAEVQSMHFTSDSRKLVLFTGTFTTRIMMFTVASGRKSTS